MPYEVSVSVRHHGNHPLILTGSIALAAIAGYVNVAMLQVFSVPVSHMSGAVSRLGIDLGSGAFDDVRLIVVIPLAFLAGAVTCGAVIGSQRLRASRRYGRMLLLEAACLGAAAWCNTDGNRYGVPLAAAACGMQNALASSYCGLIVRTTHVTGIVTDFGVLLGQWLRHRTRAQKGWKLGMLAGIFSGFFGGGLLAALANHYLGAWLLLPAALMCALLGLLYFRWQWRRRRNYLARIHIPKGRSSGRIRAAR
jgi:uncharacterized membrane protein YoaK (UPF0700 family)